MNEHDGEQLSAAPDGLPDAMQPAWRREFPIDTAQDHYVARRGFVKFLVLTSFAFVAGQFWIVIQNWLRSRQGKLPIRRIVSIGEVPVGDTLLFYYPNDCDGCILLRPTADTLIAYSQKCTHLSCAVFPEMQAGCLHCPCHHGVFELATGRPIAGPPRRPLARVVLEVQDGIIYATDVELRAV